jgi:hypothetical protein
MRIWVALTGVLLPLLSLACGSGDRRHCQEEFRALVTFRTEALEGAFGSLFAVLPSEIKIKFVKRKDPDYLRFGGNMAYDREHATLILPRRILNANTPTPVRAAAYYWPFYEDEQYRQEFPIVEALDNVLWNAYLQEAAYAAGLTWPHKDCASVHVEKRLPCEMVITGIAEYVKSVRSPLFNSNRLDIIWPEDFSDFRNRVWRTDQAYQDVRRYGGILLTRPLINEFGVPRTLAYLAQTPFQVEDGNLHVSALRYQDHARESLNASRNEPLLWAFTRNASGTPAPATTPSSMHASHSRSVVATAEPKVKSEDSDKKIP